jgi:hypothetical protein
MPTQLSHVQSLVPRLRYSIWISCARYTSHVRFLGNRVAPHLFHAPRVQLHRSATTTSTTKLRDLPQGALQLEPYDDGADDAPRYPTVVQGHLNNMQKFKNCVVLTRVGSFYEVDT